MKAVFADTFYFLALLNRRDPLHSKALAVSRTPQLVLVTTEFVLLELADALSKPPLREEALSICELVNTDPAFRLIRADSQLLQRGLEFYKQRSDKDWQLTDCISFLVMQAESISEALTGDRHFEQAGFKALLKE
jgi:predicted nucleic acid-binding protein